MQDIDIQEASEPTDIIWENRHWTPTDRNIKRGIVYTIIAIALTISGIIIFLMTKKSLELKFKYPKQYKGDGCNVFNNLYGVNSTGFASKYGSWASDSVKEWDANLRDENDTRPVHFGGIMQCFCENQANFKKADGDGVKIDRLYYRSLDQQPSDSDPGTPICQLLKKDQFRSKVLG